MADDKVADTKGVAPPAPLPEKASKKSAKVKVVKSFRLTRADHSFVDYGPGEHDMPAEDAEHWYTKAHSDDPPPPVYKPGTQEYAMDQRLQQQKAMDEPGKAAK